jgi:hypothetical protein
LERKKRAAKRLISSEKECDYFVNVQLIFSIEGSNNS